MKKIFLALTMLLTIVSYGYSAEVFSIRSADDWRKFVSMVEDAKNAYDVNAVLETDISLNSAKDIAGYTGNYPYRGIFDGNGHTLNLNISDNANNTGLFSHVANATFKNLRLTGSVSSSRQHHGSLIGSIDGGYKVTIESCHSSVTLKSSVNGDATMGGFVGVVNSNSNVTFINCMFDGSFEGGNCYANGGFVGWSNGAVTIECCLFSPSALNTKFDYCRTWARGQNPTVTNSYATREYSVFIIRNATDWGTFIEMIKTAKGEYWVDAALANDISIVNTAAMDSDAPWYGTFDGNGHTINVNISGSNLANIALFRYGRNFTINNLNVKGTITAGDGLAGLVGSAEGVNGANKIRNCRVSTTLKPTQSARTASGFIGKGNADIVNCRFDGTITCATSSTYAAAFVYTGGNNVECATQNCLEKGTYENTGRKAFNYRGVLLDFFEMMMTWGNDYNQWTFNNWSYNNLDGASSVGNKSAGDMVTQLGSSWKLDGTIIVPKMTDNLATNRWYNGQMTASEMVEILGVGNWKVVDGKAVPDLNKQWNYVSTGSSSGKTLGSGTYYITKNLSFTNTAGRSGLTIANGATVFIHVPKDVTLEAQGGDASGRTGAGAGIELPQSSTLVLMGEGRVFATGGDAANGENGGQGDDGNWKDSGDGNGVWGGNGGAGGNGGGGAGAGIGTRGADGGSGGSKAHTSVINWDKANGVKGNNGSQGGTAQPMGTLFIEQTNGLVVETHGGSAGRRAGNGGAKGRDGFRHVTSGFNYTLAGGGGGGGGGFGGKANDIGTGGPGGGGGGGGSGGSIGKNLRQLYRAGSFGGYGGYSADGSQAGKGTNSYITDAYQPEIHNDRCGKSYDNEGWKDGIDTRAGAGSGAGCGGESKSSPTDKKYYVRFNLMDKFSSRVDESKSYTAGFKSNVDGVQIDFTIPTFDEVGLIQQDKYLYQWNTKKDGKGTWVKVGDNMTIGSGITELYVEWKNFKDIFPEGSGTKSDPFIIEDDDLIALADFVNGGASTRNLYFKQQGDINVKDILEQHNKGKNWTPIGLDYVFEGDYDGGGHVIRNARMNNVNGTSLGIFGRVAGCIHNLGVETVTIFTNDKNARCGALAGILCQDGQGMMAGQVRNCYAVNNDLDAYYVGGLVGEMKENTSMSHCLSIGLTRSGRSSWGSLACIIHEKAKVDLCFSIWKHSSNGYNSATNSPIVDSQRMASGEITWLLNDKTAFATTWYQNVDGEGTPNDYPVLDSKSKPVFYDGSKYTNKPSGTIFELTGKGTSKEPFLINNLSDWEFMAKYCNEGNKTTGIHFLQTADFDLKDAEFTIPRSFDGYYDGGGHTIRNGNIEADGVVGIFGVVTGTVTRLCVEKTTIKYRQEGMRAGGIAARLTGNGEISNCLVTGCKVENNGKSGVVGGIVSDMFDKSVIRNCLVVKTSLTATRIGYICSDTKIDTRIERCYTDGNALVSSDHKGTIVDCAPGLDESNLGNGEIAYELNNSSDINPEPAWYQNLTDGDDCDSIPVLSSSHAMVFKRNGRYTNDYFDLSSLGKGTKEDPYKIGTAKDFMNLIKTIGVMKRSNFYVLQTADIDLKDSVLVPIGTCTDGFEGHYDGGGHVIRNVEMEYYKDNPDESMGLFNNIIGTVERLGIENSSFKADGPVNRVGAFAGRLSGNGVLRNCFVKGTTVDFHETPGVVVGALVGEQTDNSSIEACYGYQNTVIGQADGRKHYGYIVGYIGENAKQDLVFTDGPALCADKQSGAKNIVHAETNVSDFRFNAGEICWLLNGSKDNGTVWHQTMHTDSWPVLNSDHKPVYRYAKDAQVLYTNTNEVPYTIWLSLYPNYDEKPAETFRMFKPDDNYITPNIQLKSHAVERPGYELTGWSTEQNGKGTFYTYDGEVLPGESSINLYAVWDIKMPVDGATKVVVLENLRKDTAFFKVYDDGGYRLPYSPNCNGKLTLKAPAGRCLRLTGTVATEAPGSDGKARDYMSVYEKDEDNQLVKLTNEKGKSVFYSQSNGDKLDIGSIISSAEEITIEFVSDAENCYEGLNLMVTILPPGVMDLAGTGTAESPFQVGNPADLKAVNDYIKVTKDSKIYVKQVGDIDLNGEVFTPIASSVTNFEGHYDGGGYVIRNGKIETTSFGGIFGVVTGEVERLGVENLTCKNNENAGHARVGTIAGRVRGSGKISNCYVKGCTIEENQNGVAGGIVADIYDEGIISNCFVYQSKVSSVSSGGYLCGEMMSGTQLVRCYTDGDKMLGAYAKGEVMDSNPNMNAEQFSSGEICYLLNGEKTENVVWRQTLGTDTVPVFTDSHSVVYRYRRNDKDAYSNTVITTPQYYISSREDFEAFIEKEGDIHLTQNINIGNTGFYLRGNFDGGGHSINYGGENEQLFKSIEKGGTVKHLQVLASIRSSSDCGGIAYENQGTISDCHFHGFIRGYKGFLRSAPDIAGIAVIVSDNGTIDHCTFTGYLTKEDDRVQTYTITKDMGRATNCTWVNPNDQTLYAAQRDSALNAQAEYPVYAKGILDAVGPEIVLGNQIINVPGKHLSSLTINDGERFKCSAEVKVDQITYKRRGTDGAYEPWVLPFDYTIDASMLGEGMEFYWFEKDSVGNIVTKQIESGETYQAAANEPLAFRSTNADEIAFKMKLVKDGKNQSMTIQMPLDGVAASMASTKDIARVMVTYDSIAAAKTVKERMYLWNNDKGDFVMGNGEQGVTPFRYYLQYLDKATNNFLKYEQTDWARKQRNSGGSQQAPQRRTEESASFSTLLAQGWQPIILDLTITPTITAQMLDDYEILCLSDIYEQKADNQRYDVTVIYEPVEEDMTLPYAAPLLVRAKRADVEPLVTEEMGAELIAIMEEALSEMDEEEKEKASESLFESCHYWCSTFAGRYDVWQMLLPESDNLLNEYGALVFGNTAGDYHFYRVPASDGFSMQPMSYCFTAYDNKTYENLLLTNDRIEIVVYGYTEQSDPTGIEDVRSKMDDVRGKMDDVYNLNGQKVRDSYRGIIIKNGRKILKR